MNLPPLVRLLLWPLSQVYGGYVRVRAALYRKGWLKQKRLRGKVISVGNLTVGGTGKTPMVMWLAEKLLAQGKRVAILSRGYRGAGGTSDEIELMKHRLQDRVTFGVGKDRFAEGQRIEQQDPIDVFLLDDGFQHLALARDLDILMLDGSYRLEDQQLLPAGILREPASALRRADMLVVTRKIEQPDIDAARVHKFSISYAQTRLLGFRRCGPDASIHNLDEIGPGPFFAFCGIGNPRAFFDDLNRWEVPVAGQSIFRDHHRYSAAELCQLEKSARNAGAIAFVTTEKDRENFGALNGVTMPLFVAVIDFVFPAETEFMATMEQKLQSRQKQLGTLA